MDNHSTMKRYLFQLPFLFFLFLYGGSSWYFSLSAQSLFRDQPVEKRESPPDTVIGFVGKTKILIDYSRPYVKGRKIWGDLVPYDKIWRTGANEATVFEISKDLKIEGQLLPAGKYALFTEPGETEWRIIFNSMWDQWGVEQYKERHNVLSVTVKPGKAPNFTEQFTFYIVNKRVFFRWENLEVGFKVSE